MRRKVTDRKTWMTWYDMIKRCYNPKYKRYFAYGGRGIQVCEEWKSSFDNFFRDMGTKPEGHSIERINNDGNYELSNCKWATPKEQAQNRRPNRNLEFRGEIKNMQQWSKELGISHAALSKRLKNWGIEKALTTERMEKYVRNPNGY